MSPTACTSSATTSRTSRTKRRCPLCGTVLTWNPNDVCCCCEDKLLKQASGGSHRTKIDPSQYPVLLRLREEGWTNKKIAQFFGANTNYISELINRIKRGGQ